MGGVYSIAAIIAVLDIYVRTMSDSAMDNLVLERLREIRTLLGEVKEDTADTRLRAGMLEAGYASVSLRLDRLAADVDRIKRRLDLVDVPG
jgi:hypothetical protein